MSFGKNVYVKKTRQVCCFSEVPCEQIVKYVIGETCKGKEKFVFFGAGAKEDDPDYENCVFHGETLINVLAHYKMDKGAVNVFGGGEIKFSSNSNSFRIWGKSTTYGKEPDRKESIKIIEEITKYRINKGDF